MVAVSHTCDALVALIHAVFVPTPNPFLLICPLSVTDHACPGVSVPIDRVVDPQTNVINDGKVSVILTLLRVTVQLLI